MEKTTYVSLSISRLTILTADQLSYANTQTLINHSAFSQEWHNFLGVGKREAGLPLRLKKKAQLAQEISLPVLDAVVEGTNPYETSELSGTLTEVPAYLAPLVKKIVHNAKEELKKELAAAVETILGAQMQDRGSGIEEYRMNMPMAKSRKRQKSSTMVSRHSLTL